MARSVIEAIKSGDVSLAKKLLQGRRYGCIDCQTARRDGTALFWASCRGLLDIVQILLNQGANINALTAWGASPLHAAADNDHLEVLRLLLQCGANVNSQTNNGDTPCHLAAYRGYADAVQILVESGASLDIYNSRLHSALDEAEKGSHTGIVEYLTAVSDLVCACTKTIQDGISGTPVPLNENQRLPLMECNTGGCSRNENNWTEQLSPIRPPCQYFGENDLSLPSEKMSNESQWTYTNIPF